MKSLLHKVQAQFTGDSLRKNSTLLILSQAVSTVAGFLFWIICAHVFHPSQIGFATSLTSYAGLVATFTSFGLANTVIRFLPTSKRKGGLLTGSLLAVFAASVVGGLIGWAGLRVFVPRLSFVGNSVSLSLLLVGLVIGTNLSAIMDSALLAFRKANLVLGKSALVSVLRLILPLFLVSYGLGGIMAVAAAVLWAGILYSLVVVFRKLLPGESLRPTLTDITAHRSYALSNYFGGMLGMLPGALTPIIILSKLGATSAAYYYMPVQVATFLGILASSVSQALISETSQTDDLVAHRAHFRAALKHLYMLLVPAAALLVAVGWVALRVYGPGYAANGFGPLVVLAIASFFTGINWLGDTWLNIQKRHTAFMYMNACNAAAVLAGVYFLAGRGLVYAALGALLGQAVSAAIYVAIFARGQLLSFVSPRRTR